MTIHITQPEIEAIIQQRLQSGAFRDAEEVILDALRSSKTPPAAMEQGGPDPDKKSLARFFAESPLKSLDLKTGQPATNEEWLREFHAWVHSHPTDTPLLSDEAISRDSIYRERGL